MSDADAPSPFQYELPKELIAQEPLPNRADARLLVVDRAAGSLTHCHVRDLPDLVRRGDRLILNDTKVVAAQLTGRRDGTGGAWQGLFLAEEPGGEWRLICKTRGKLDPPETVTLLDRDGRDAARLWLLERLGDGEWLGRIDSDESTEATLRRVGRVPLPPYIRGGRMVDADIERYQTVYARRPGAVAAPTAGLHLTEPLLRQMEQRGAEFSAVTLHVGRGTFRPMTTSAAEHEMHQEWCEVSSATADAINQTRAAGGRLIAVGTTAVRTLETAAKEAEKPGPIAAWSGQTGLFITPPHEFRAVDALMTNFHFPQTTLLLLVEAFAGGDLIREAYAEAIRERYRFYSYGDAMLIV